MKKEQIKNLLIDRRRDLLEEYNNIIGGKLISNVTQLDIIRIIELHQSALEKLFAGLELLIDEELNH